MAEMSLPEGAPIWLWALFIVAPVFSAISVAWIAARGNKQIKKNQEKATETLDEVREHVANTHSTNLRDDIDKISDGMADIKAVLFDQDRKLDCMSNRIDGVNRKVEVYRDVVEKFLIDQDKG